MADVFVSYHKQDRARAEQAVASLTAHGYSVWWDERVTPMESWDKIVEREIRQAKCVLVLWTKSSVDSEWVRIEANFAKVARPAKLVQVRLEECDVPMNFSLIQHADAFAPALDPKLNLGWRRALEWVGLFVGARPANTEDVAEEEALKPAPAPKPRKRRVKRAASPPNFTSAPALQIRPLASGAAKPAIDPGALLDRFLGAASSIFKTRSFYTRALTLLAASVLIGAFVYAAVFSLYIENGSDFLRYSASLLLRLCVGAAIAFALFNAKRLDQRDAIILVVGYVGIYFTYRVLAVLFGALPTPPSEGAVSLTGDLAALGLLWMLAQHLGAMRPQRRWLAPILATGVIVFFAFGYAAAIDAEMTPPAGDTLTWGLFLGLSLVLEGVLMLTLLEPLRAAPEKEPKP